MRLSVIVTSYNIAPWLGRCLDSLGPCLRPGDEVIVLDDGSTDGSAEIIAARETDGGIGPGIGYRPVLLGTNTPGGVGTAANIGLAEATGEAVFFVDGDDWLLAEGMRGARRAFEAAGTDILIANYVEHDEVEDILRRPADTGRWDAIRQARLASGRAVTGSTPAARDAARQMALGLIAVPWRKFYRRALLEGAGLRFPEGDFFYEDNPFHWEVCLAADSLAFWDREICAHRIGRPGQTMGETGVALTAFFTHYETIAALLRRHGTDAASPLWDLLGEWIVGNMSWHLRRLRSAALWDYAIAASPVLRGIPDDRWARLKAGRFRGDVALRAGDQLRQMAPAEVALLWQAEMSARRGGETEATLVEMRAEIDRLGGVVARLEQRLAGLTAAAEFEALQRIATLGDAASGAATDGESDG